MAYGVAMTVYLVDDPPLITVLLACHDRIRTGRAAGPFERS